MTVEDLYRSLIEAWNARDAVAFEALFIVDGEVVGFDGSHIMGQGAIGEEMRKIFTDHPTNAYVTRIHGVTTVATDVAIVRAVAGMIPRGRTTFEPSLHAIQRLTAVQRGGAWRVALFQTTPALFHGRPEAVLALTRELAGELPD